MGAALGGAAAGWPGAILGGLLGAGAGGETPTLEEALGQVFAEHGYQLLRVARDSQYSVVLLFRKPPHFGWSLRVVVPPSPALTSSMAIDDALYDRAVQVLATLTAPAYGT